MGEFMLGFLSTVVFTWCATLTCRRLEVRTLIPIQIALDENRAPKRRLAPLTARGRYPGVRSFEALSEANPGILLGGEQVRGGGAEELDRRVIEDRRVRHVDDH